MENNIHLLGVCNDVPNITAGLDIATSSSAYGEGFPNVIAEAMCCGVCCVATNVGDSRRIIGNTGWVVAKKDVAALTRAWADAIEMGPEGRKSLGDAARKRILDRYSIERCVGSYDALYRDLAS